MIKIVKGNKYFWNDNKHRWEGLKDNATELTIYRYLYLKRNHFSNDTYFVKVK